MSFSQFKRERQYLNNVSATTLEWYTHALKWLPSEAPTQDELKEAVLRMREKGLKASGCNSAIRAINAYLHWASPEGTHKCCPQCKHPRIAQLKEEGAILPTFSAVQVRQLVKWKPKDFYPRRLHLLVLFLLDTGCRITEALSLGVSEIDMDNLLVTLDGKGRKQRVVPFSFELRKHLFRYMRDFSRKPNHLLFATGNNAKLGRRNTLRDVKNLCRRIGFEPPKRTQHACRHTFAVNYLRRGGSVFHLQKALGHATLEMTRRYVNLLTEDLQAVHESVSLLAG
jgi:integrase/recombinase XerD